MLYYVWSSDSRPPMTAINKQTHETIISTGYRPRRNQQTRPPSRHIAILSLILQERSILPPFLCLRRRILPPTALRHSLIFFSTLRRRILPPNIRHTTHTSLHLTMSTTPIPNSSQPVLPQLGILTLTRSDFIAWRLSVEHFARSLGVLYYLYKAIPVTDSQPELESHMNRHSQAQLLVLTTLSPDIVEQFTDVDLQGPVYLLFDKIRTKLTAPNSSVFSEVDADVQSL